MSFRIADLPRFRTLIEKLEAVAALQNSMLPDLTPILLKMGVRVPSLQSRQDQLQTLRAKLLQISEIPDRFNRALASRGWIAFEALDVDVAESAVEAAESGDVTRADAILVDYFSPQKINMFLRRMRAIKAFRPRMDLATKAYTDFVEGRYHACVPVLLAQIDGLVHDLHEDRASFFGNDTKIDAWDSIAAHSTGLSALSALFAKGRYKTRTESIDVPYRHGIVHGADLGYANVLVATKTWAALFAVREWAYLVEAGLDKELPQKTYSLRDLADNLQLIDELKERLDAWKPRSIEIGVDLPLTPDLTSLDAESPEYVVVEFVLAWQSRNYGRMASCLSSTMWNYGASGPARVREIYQNLELRTFHVLSIHDEAAGACTVTVEHDYLKRGIPTIKIYEYRVLYLSESGEPLARGMREGSWGLQTWTVS